jgi:glycosyltransferase involved in cell wall biosynthesis
MRICLVSQEYPPETAHGGIGTQIWNRAHELASRGHQVEVLSCRKDPQEPPGKMMDGEVLVHRMLPPGEGTAQELTVYDQSVYMLGYTWQVACELERLLKRTDFDLINFPEYGAEGLAYQLNRTPHNWKPVVVHLHGPLAMFAERVHWPVRDGSFFRVADFMEGESIRLADGLMASSSNIADYAADRYGVPRDSIHVVHCGVDCRVFRPLGPEEKRHHRPTVIFVGNASASKGIWCVFEAVMGLRSRYPDIRLQVLGQGDQLEALECRARELGAQANLEVVGFVADRSRLPEYYRRAHVLAAPAYHEVGVANVYAEAMACGCPVVACNTGGAPEAVRHGESGFLLPPKDIEGTRAALDRLLGDQALRESMGRAGRRRAEEYFALDRYIERILAAYEDAMQRSRDKLMRLSGETEACRT